MEIKYTQHEINSCNDNRITNEQIFYPQTYHNSDGSAFHLHLNRTAGDG